ncbi:ATP-binding protein [Ottowia sp. VDI28]|uniref:sensor histidine kinase n=1 Tax=unclassified Ottowia TaxID=2645081 RepID=UPI003C303002
MAAVSDFDESSTSQVPDADVFDTMNAPLEYAPESEGAEGGFSLFWRTFFLLSLLLLGSSVGWYQLFRTLEYEPRVIENARQVASLVNLSRAALVHSDAIARVSLIKTLAEQEKVRILPREPGDKFELFAHTELEQRMNRELVARLGRGTVVASSVNNEPGLWVGFAIEGDSYWLLMDRSRIGSLLGGSAWLLWLATLGVISLIGAALLARLIDRPLRQLSIAAARVREGDYLKSRLDERALSSEVRAVNIGFNRMADQLSKIEQNRAEMLAGISHDLRTPLARLRLETEMSVPDPEAREHMAADIAQVDSIINKFLDYARPDHVNLQALPLAELVTASVMPFTAREDMQVKIDVPADLRVMGDEIELLRTLSNLLENARRYGQTPGTSITQVHIAAAGRDHWVIVRVRDHGPGVRSEVLPDLTRPFFRGDTARTSATGAGLGLSIVAKMVGHMGGTLVMSNSSTGGLVATIRLQQASDARTGSMLKKKR